MNTLKKLWLITTGRRKELRRKNRHRPAEKPKPEITPLGFKLAGHDAMASGKFEPEETFVISRLLDDADLFVNIGANIGYYCCLALQVGKPVIAFEPIAANIDYLISNVRANGWDSSIEIYPIALTDRIGAIDIYGWSTWASVLKGWAGTPEQHVTQVPTNRLDNVLAARTAGKKSVILVDIEGAEYLMLGGAEQILTQTPAPVWVVEINIDEHQPGGLPINPKLRETFDRFWAFGYNAFKASKTPQPVTPVDIDRVIATGENLIGTHNFIFTKSHSAAALIDSD